MRFILTGSSGRKLKRSGVNMLAGRAWEAHLFPLTYGEIPDFSLEKYLLFGGLPQVYGSKWPEEELDAYINTYLREEIKEEALVQNFTHFCRFLKVAALSNAEQLNYANISRIPEFPPPLFARISTYSRKHLSDCCCNPGENQKRGKPLPRQNFIFLMWDGEWRAEIGFERFFH